VFVVKCRHCRAELTLPFLDLGAAPPSNAYLTPEQLSAPEVWYPLRVFTCTQCWLVQTEDYAHHAELFSGDYAYFSSYSTTWLAHAERYVADMTARFALGSASHVVEIAANDGYLLQYVKARDIACLGIEPTASTAHAARARGIETIERFFGTALADELAAQGKQADLAVANNVLAHVPDINDFVAGFSRLLQPGGVATFEFPHLMRLVQEHQFDTVYHEHFSYLSLTVVQRIFAAGGLSVFDVEELATHGGSLRVFAQRTDAGRQPVHGRVRAVLEREELAGIKSLGFYEAFQVQADRVKREFLAFLLDAKQRGRQVAAYGAAAKGNTLMNYAGVRPDLLAYVADRSPAKRGKYMPGSRIPIVDEMRIDETRPDYVVILPWNLKAEVMHQLSRIERWGGKFVTAVPRLEVA
jgi:SAM-dependent methyltransferase